MILSRVIGTLVLALAAYVPALTQEIRSRREDTGYINTDEPQPPSGPSVIWEPQPPAGPIYEPQPPSPVIWDPTPWPHIPRPNEEIIHRRPGSYPPGDSRLPRPPAGQPPGFIVYPYGDVDMPLPPGERPAPHIPDSGPPNSQPKNHPPSDPTGPPFIPWRLI